jgi:serine/threonine protein kinase
MKDGTEKTITRTDWLLGKGGQGSVYLGIDKQDGKEYAIKIYDLSNCSESKRKYCIEDFERECDLYNKVNSPYIVKLYGFLQDSVNHKYYLLQEYCNYDLQKLINQRGVFSDTQAKKIINQIFRAQYDFSLQKVIHRDLKPANIGIHINTLTNDVLQDDSALADFIKTFDFATNLDKYCIKFFDLGFSETVDENGFGSA